VSEQTNHSYLPYPASRPGDPERGSLVTPTGRLVLYPDELGGERWLQARRVDPTKPRSYRIGSSDVPSILDLEGVDTPLHVYHAKVSDIRPEPNEAMQWGHLLEQPIALEWCRRNRAVIDEVGLLARDGAPWHLSTIDRRVRECPVERGGECLLEIKNVGFASAARWHREIPDRILAQIVHQLYVTGYAHAHYACLVGGNTMKQGIIYAEREAKLMAYLVAEVNRFREEHLLAGVAPAWTGDKPDKMIALDNAMHPERNGIAELDLDGIGEVMEYATLSAQEGAAAKRKKKIAAKLRGLAAGAEIATFSNERAYWYTEGRRSNVDLDKLKELWPEAYEQCVSEKKYPILHIDSAYKMKGDKS